MPSAEMRRNTRIFGARVLRSGRRVSTVSKEGKHIKTKNVSEWIDLLDDSGDEGGDGTNSKEKAWCENDGLRQQECTMMDIDKKPECRLENTVVDNLIVHRDNERMFGVVYTRKRKKLNSNVVSCSVDGEKAGCVDKRFLKHFVRRKWRKKARLPEVANISDSTVSLVTRGTHQNVCGSALVILVRPWCNIKYIVTCFLASVLRYTRRARIGIDQLAGFFLSRTVSDICSSCGVHFMLDSGSLPERGFCIISDTSFVPVFYIDSSAIPSSFLYLQSCIQLRFASIVLTLRDGSSSGTKEEEDDRIPETSVHSKIEQVADLAVTSVIDFTKVELVPHLDVCPAKVTGQSVQLRNIRNRKKGNSLRSKRGRPSSTFRPRISKITAKSPGPTRDSSQLPSRLLYRDPRNVTQRNTRSSMQQLKSTTVGFCRSVDPESCIANILVMESDKCYREAGAVISLELSSGKRWHLAIKKNGVLQYSLIAQKFMRPCTSNRFTRAIIWNIENGWKLEFTDRLEWSAFKELYKQCADRNVHVPLESFIPIPEARELPARLSSKSYFTRPGSYISVKDDELARALARTTSNYDMESDDEEWLSKFNEDNAAENESHKLLSEEDFELIIDAFERGFHCNPDDYGDESVVPSISLNVVPRAVEAVYGHWIRKRKQKRSPLIRVFQFYQPRRTQFIPKSFLRKKRSFKRQGVKSGRGKQPTFLQALAAEQSAQEHRNAILKVEETKAAARRSEGVAVLKRQRAQQLMENADLATYKAVMALRIAELAQISESADAAGLS